VRTVNTAFRRFVPPLVVLALLVLTVPGVDATITWCKKDPPIKVQKPNGDWKQANIFWEADKLFRDNNEATSDLVVTIRVPLEATAAKYKDESGSWRNAAWDEPQLVGAGFNGNDEYVVFTRDGSLDIRNGDITIQVSATQSGTEESRDREVRYKLNPTDSSLPTKVSDPTGTIANPPAPLQGRI
jgi:hypothetical protein